MKIERIELYLVGLKLTAPWETAFGRTERIDTVLLKMSSEGIYGWGESSPTWYYSPESPGGVFATIEDFLVPRIIGKSVASGEALQQLMSQVKGNQFAKAVLDLAWWDLHAKVNQKPLWKCIGGENQKVEVGASFGVMNTIEELIEKIQTKISIGYGRVKLKYKPGWDLEVVESVRKAFPDVVLHVDHNSAYSLDDLDMFKELDNYNLAMHEQPLAYDDLIDHAELARTIKTPICLDESIKSADHARKAAKIGACKYVNIKPGRVGGITNALQIHDICLNEGIPCWIGGQLESSLGVHHLLALATLPNIGYSNDLCVSDEFYPEYLSHPDVTMLHPAHMTAPSVPGCGSEPDQKRLKKQTIAMKVFES